MMALAFERIMPTALVTSVSHVVDHDETPMGSYYPMQNVQAAGGRPPPPPRRRRDVLLPAVRRRGHAHR